jgi:hypothetical protein
MFKLVKRRNVVPKYLFITGITAKTLQGIGKGLIGQTIFRGELNGKQVALRVAYKKVRDNVSALIFLILQY